MAGLRPDPLARIRSGAAIAFIRSCAPMVGKGPGQWVETAGVPITSAAAISAPTLAKHRQP
jgi:hypothetical protein